MLLEDVKDVQGQADIHQQENFICTEASFRRIWAAADGVRFYYAADRTYLADSVPPEYLIKVERE